jgi:hypothetical protein
MEQHPVPQQISSYQFKLVGDMTLKQFFEVAGGVVVALIIYSLPLPAFLRWPFIIVSVLFGAALAFLPIEERPLESWVIAFIRSIYQPTMFYWKKPEVPPQYFLKPSTAPASAEGSTTTTNAAFLNNLESGERAFFSNITKMFSSQAAKAYTPNPAEGATIVNPQVEVQKNTPTQVPFSPPRMVVPQENMIQTPPPQFPKKLVIPQVPPLQVEKSQTPVPGAPTPTATPLDIKPESVYQILPNQPVQVGSAPQKFSPEAEPPATPTQPNIIVGQVMDPQGKILEGAILEIKDMQGRPVRALKSNRVGHFFIVTPLTNGEYQLSCEKDGQEFETINIFADGKIIEPVAVKSKGEIKQ